MNGTTDVRETLPQGKSKRGEPTWELAALFPLQGDWTEEAYLALARRTNRLVELSDGCLEILPMPTPFHQRIVRFLFQWFEAFVRAQGLGEMFFAPLPVRLWPSKFRDPDLVFLRSGRVGDPHQQPQGADLAVEVVSEGEEARTRDLVTKRDEYARAGIAEYWIVDPQQQCITVLVLDGATYREHGLFTPGQRASSVLLPGFEVAVSDVFAAGQG